MLACESFSAANKAGTRGSNGPSGLLMLSGVAPRLPREVVAPVATAALPHDAAVATTAGNPPISFPHTARRTLLQLSGSFSQARPPR